MVAFQHSNLVMRQCTGKNEKHPVGNTFELSGGTQFYTHGLGRTSRLPSTILLLFCKPTLSSCPRHYTRETVHSGNSPFKKKNNLNRVNSIPTRLAYHNKKVALPFPFHTPHHALPDPPRRDLCKHLLNPPPTKASLTSPNKTASSEPSSPLTSSVNPCLTETETSPPNVFTFNGGAGIPVLSLSSHQEILGEFLPVGDVFWDTSRCALHPSHMGPFFRRVLVGRIVCSWRESFPLGRGGRR